MAASDGGTVRCPYCQFDVPPLPRCESCGEPLPPPMPTWAEEPAFVPSADPGPFDPAEPPTPDPTYGEEEVEEQAAVEPEPLPFEPPEPEPEPLPPADAGPFAPADPQPADPPEPQPIDPPPPRPDPKSGPTGKSESGVKPEPAPVGPPPQGPPVGLDRPIGGDPGSLPPPPPPPPVSPVRPETRARARLNSIGWRLVADFQFAGRMGRNEFWKMFAIRVGVVLVCYLIAADGIGDPEMGEDSDPFALLAGLAMIVVAISGLAECSRRLHDTGKSGWWNLLNLVPYLGFFALCFLLAQDGERHDNQYGAVPDENARI
jgi:uncharacterized membrane protein YhaH (DUF805 family)